MRNVKAKIQLISCIRGGRVLPIQSEEFTSAARYATIDFWFDRTGNEGSTLIKPYNYDCNSWDMLIDSRSSPPNSENHWSGTEDCGSAGDQTMGIDIAIGSDKNDFGYMKLQFSYSSSMPEEE